MSNVFVYGDMTLVPESLLDKAERERDKAKADAEYNKRLWVYWEGTDKGPLTQGAVNALHAEHDLYKRERDAAREEIAALRKALVKLVGETDPEILEQMASALRVLGRTAEADACEVLARWPEVKP